MALPKPKLIDPDVLEVLSTALLDPDLPGIVLPEQLERKLYERTAKVLKALGATWSRKDQAHIFDTTPAAFQAHFDAVLQTGLYTPPELEGFFPTPPALAKRMLFKANLSQTSRVLEPSAGDGALIEAMLGQYPGLEILAVEQ